LSSESRVPRIETERLILRELTDGDIPFLFEHFSKDEINEYSSEENLASMVEAKDLFEKYIVPRPGLFRLGLVLRETEELIGTIGFYGIDHTSRRAIVGADLMRSHWGKGFMTEALRALISYGFKEMKLNRIEATADPQNLRSLRLMERCGFKKEGVLRQRFYYKGSFHDDAIYSLLNREWSDAQ
jgi:ribosomal-protein-alanine N-acetyltransferase